jgi:hypothetical protein
MSNRFTRLNIALMLLDEARFASECSELLSPREREVAVLVARGLTNKEVGAELRLSDGTVKQHVHNIFLKLARLSPDGRVNGNGNIPERSFSPRNDDRVGDAFRLATRGESDNSR